MAWTQNYARSLLVEIIYVRRHSGKRELHFLLQVEEHTKNSQICNYVIIIYDMKYIFFKGIPDWLKMAQTVEFLDFFWRL